MTSDITSAPLALLYFISFQDTLDYQYVDYMWA